MTESELQALCEEWQKILGLKDWYVKVMVKRATNMPMEDKSGSINWVLARKEALMTLLDPIDYPEDAIRENNMEETIIHELLHLHIAPFDETKRDSLEETAMEQAIHALERAFIELKHPNKGGKHNG